MKASNPLLVRWQGWLKQLGHVPGVYCMRDASGNPLYIGKAQDLKKRVSSYFQSPASQSAKHWAWLHQVDRIDITVTHHVLEALLLESSLIRSLKPKYNVLLKDDKSFSYLVLSSHPFARLSIEREIEPNTIAFGPYTSRYELQQMVRFLQRLFLLRSCSDRVFEKRKTPCLLYQIKQCSAPCVGYIGQSVYTQKVQEAQAYLKGTSGEKITILQMAMQSASEKQDYERALQYRNRLRTLQQLQHPETVYHHEPDAEVVVVASAYGERALHWLRIREGRIVESLALGPYPTGGAEDHEALEQWLYAQTQEASHQLSQRIFINIPLSNLTFLQEILKKEKNITLKKAIKNTEKQWISMAEQSVKQTLMRHLSAEQRLQQQWLDLQYLLKLESLTYIHSFDVSHHQGRGTVGTCVIFQEYHPKPLKHYTWSLEQIGNNDYEAFKQLAEHYDEWLKENPEYEAELCVLDGGTQQIDAFSSVLKMKKSKMPLILSLAKGVERKVGLEELWIYAEDHYQNILLPPHDKGRLLLQRVRDQAHHFAGKAQRKKVQKISHRSILAGIPGVGPMKQQTLLKTFGGAQGLYQASVSQLSQHPGIGLILAQRIYDHLHPSQELG